MNNSQEPGMLYSSNDTGDTHDDQATGIPLDPITENDETREMYNKQVTRASHDAIAEKYFEAYSGDTSDLKYFDEFLTTVSGNKILDLGCGMGHYSQYMSNKGFQVTGIDFSEGMLNIAKRTYKQPEFLVGDVCNLEIINGRKFNGVVLAFLLHHLSKKEVEDLFSNLRNYLEPDAKLLILLREGNEVLEEEEPFNRDFTYIINEYSQEEIESILSKNGYDIIKMEEKEYIDDPDSLSPNTLVVMAQNK